jgi:hypothetical protein
MQICVFILRTVGFSHLTLAYERVPPTSTFASFRWRRLADLTGGAALARLKHWLFLATVDVRAALIAAKAERFILAFSRAILPGGHGEPAILQHGKWRRACYASGPPLRTDGEWPCAKRQNTEQKSLDIWSGLFCCANRPVSQSSVT